MIALLRMMRALFLRGWYSMLSYRFALYLKYVAAAFQLLLFYLIWQVFKDFDTNSPHLTDADGNWFAYAITGGLAMTVLGTAMGSMVRDIRSGQVMGTLETILASPMSVTLLLSANWVYSFSRTILSLFISLSICVWLLDFKWSDMNFITMGVVFLALVVAFTPLGILSAAFTLAFKRGDPVALAVGISFTLFGEVIYPRTVLPGFLQPVCDWLPITYATTIVRKSVLKAASISEVSTELMVLFGFGLVLFPISIWTFNWGLNKARHDGSLSQY